jgi:hypothetical protein
MKSTIKIFALLLIVAGITSSCRKNVQVVKKLDGTWKIESQTVNGVNDTTDFSSDRVIFEKCNVNKEDCPGSITAGGTTTSITYTVSGDGNTVTVKYVLFGFTIDNVYTIIDLTKTTMHTKYTDSFGTLYDTHWSKI